MARVLCRICHFGEFIAGRVAGRIDAIFPLPPGRTRRRLAHYLPGVPARAQRRRRRARTRACADGCRRYRTC
ncbi:MAG: hypothetical protein U1F51_19005 [Burkholderiales bacterium]